MVIQISAKLGVFFNPFSLDNKSLEKESARIAKMPVDHIEILLDHYLLLRDTAELKRLKNVVSGWENIIHAPFIEISIVHPIEKISKASFEVYKDCIESARILDSNLITFHGGGYPFYLKDKKVIENSFNRFMPELIDISGENGIIIAVENMPKVMKTRKYYPSTMDEVRKVLSENRKLKFTLDIGHALENSENILDYIDLFHDSIFNVHIHDSDGKRSHVGFGKGTINMDSILKKLRKLNSYLTLEILDDKETADSFKLMRSILK